MKSYASVLDLFPLSFCMDSIALAQGDDKKHLPGTELTNHELRVITLQPVQ